jgi:hypothetical protein
MQKMTAQTVLLLHRFVVREVLLGFGGPHRALRSELILQLVQLLQTLVPAGGAVAGTDHRFGTTAGLRVQILQVFCSGGIKKGPIGKKPGLFDLTKREGRL